MGKWIAAYENAVKCAILEKHTHERIKSNEKQNHKSL